MSYNGPDDKYPLKPEPLSIDQAFTTLKYRFYNICIRIFIDQDSWNLNDLGSNTFIPFRSMISRWFTLAERHAFHIQISSYSDQCFPFHEHTYSRRPKYADACKLAVLSQSRGCKAWLGISVKPCLGWGMHTSPEWRRLAVTKAIYDHSLMTQASGCIQATNDTSWSRRGMEYWRAWRAPLSPLCIYECEFCVWYLKEVILSANTIAPTGQIGRIAWWHLVSRLGCCARRDLHLLWLFQRVPRTSSMRRNHPNPWRDCLASRFDSYLYAPSIPTSYLESIL